MPTPEAPTTLADDLRTSLASLQDTSAEPDVEVPDVPSALTEAPSEVPEPDDKPAATDGRPRREDGTFAPKPKEAAPIVKALKRPDAAPKGAVGGGESKVAAVGASAGPAQQPVKGPAADPAATALKPPTNWPPDVREKWGGLPPDVQAQITRREREIALGFEQQKGHKTEAEGWRQVTAPYDMMFRASGVEPRQGVANVLQAAATLFSGPEPVKARVIAGLVKSYGVSVESLAAALDGTAPAGGTPAAGPRVLSEQEIAAIAQRTWAAEQQKSDQQRMVAEVEGFRNHATYGEFFDDLRVEAGIQMKAAAESGVAMTAEEAFKRAAVLHDGVRSTLEGRKAAADAKAKAAEAAKKRAAASTIRSVPAPPVGEEGETDGSLRGDLELVARKLAGAR